MEKQRHRISTILVAFCIFHNEAYFDGLRLSEILGSGTSAFCEEMAAKDFAGAKLAVPITTVVQKSSSFQGNARSSYAMTILGSRGSFVIASSGGVVHDSYL